VNNGLLRLEEHEYVLMVTLHHIITDAWSQALLIQEVAELYDALGRGEDSPLDPLPIQYADYAIWQRSQLQGEALERQLAYWKEQMAGAPDSLELPTDRPRPGVQTYSAGTEHLQLPTDLSEALRTLSRRSGVTLFMTLLAAVKILLGRLAGQDDVVVWTPIAGRNRAETEKLIGFFLNTLVLRTDLSGNPTFAQLLERVREMTLGAYAHQDVPFEMLVKELQPVRDLSRTPLFQVLVNMLNLPERTLKTGEVQLEIPREIDRESKFDLTFYINESEGRIGFDLLYNADLFDAERIRLLLNQFETLLRQIAENSQVSIDDLSLVTADCRNRLPDPREPLGEPRHEPVPERIADLAWRMPDHPIVEQGGRRWTYAELWFCARRIARQLCALGIDRGQTVAVTGPRSFGLIASMIGVEASGGVLLLLDPNLPQDRQRAMLCQGSARLLIRIQPSAGENGTPPVDGDLSVLSLDTEGQFRGGSVPAERARKVT